MNNNGDNQMKYRQYYKVLLVITVISIIINVVNFIINLSDKGIASAAYILIAVFLLYKYKKNSYAIRYIFLAGLVFTAYMGLFQIITKYFTLPHNIGVILYFSPIIAMFFIGGAVIGLGFKEGK